MFCPIIYIYTIYSLVLFVRCPFLICFLCLCFLLLIPERVRCQWYLGDDGATAEHPKFILNMFEAHRIADSQICLVVLISMLVWCIYIHVIRGYIHLYPSKPHHGLDRLRQPKPLTSPLCSVREISKTKPYVYRSLIFLITQILYSSCTLYVKKT